METESRSRALIDSRVPATAGHEIPCIARQPIDSSTRACAMMRSEE